MFTLQQLQTGAITSEVLGPEKRLKLTQNLTEFPRELFDLAEDIEILDLGGNQLSDLPDDFGRFKNLKTLFLTDNQFEHIPAVLSQCEKLEIVAFKSNNVSTFAENCLPKSVFWLILTNNKIEQLPESIGDLTKLRKLALAGNRLTALPDSMAACRALELVRLSANQLTEVPDWLLELPKLSWLGFSGNPVSFTPDLKTSQMPKIDLNSVQLNEPIGEGASGIIYHADWFNKESSGAINQQAMAVKIFKGSVTSDGYPQDEIQCCLKVGAHPNLIKPLSHIEYEHELGLAMELIPSDFKNLGLPPSLQSCTRDTFEVGTTFEESDVLNIGLQMADTLQHIHRQAVSHGDIYAHNMMVNSDRTILFGDFGAATHLASLSAQQKQSMQCIEVRAFGCLLEDLLLLVNKKTSLFSLLLELSRECMRDSVLTRPSFQTIAARLSKIHSDNTIDRMAVV